MSPARGTLLAAGVLFALVVGCAGPSLDVPAFQTEIAGGNYQAALARIEAHDDDDDVADLMDRALLYSALGDPVTSNQLFEVAEQRIDDLYTRSLTDEGLSLLVNDWMLDYRAGAFEHAYIAYFRAWNYLELGLTEDVLVEARKIDERLRFRAQDCRDESGRCGHDAFLRYFCGLLYEWGGRDNDALVSYRLADEAIPTAREFYGLDAPGDLGRRLVSLSRRLGRPDDAAAYAARYGITDSEEASASIVVFVEEGMVGTRAPVELVLPIFKSETVLIEKDPETWAETLADRAHLSYETAELDYLLKISIPAFVASPAAATEVRFTLDSQTRPVYAGSDLTGQAELAFQASLGGIVVRAVARGIAKYVLKETADDQLGSVAGFVVNLWGVATENADTRSWRALPAEIRVAAVNVAPGAHQGRLDLNGLDGDTQVAFDDLHAADGEIVFVRYRTGQRPGAPETLRAGNPATQ